MPKRKKTNGKALITVPVRFLVEWDPRIPGAKEQALKEISPHQSIGGFDVKYGGYSVQVVDWDVTKAKP